jgi:hypothetical protein
MINSGTGCVGSVQAVQACVSGQNNGNGNSSSNPGKAGSGNTDGNGSGDGTPVTQISPHVYLPVNLPQVRALKIAWQVIVHQYPHGGEFSNWIRLCMFYHSLCANQFGTNFNPLQPNYALEGAWNLGISVGACGRGRRRGDAVPQRHAAQMRSARILKT